MAETAARIFGNVLGTGARSGRKLLQQPLIGERVASYYPPSIKASDPLFEDPVEKRLVRVLLAPALSLTLLGRRRKVKLERLKRRGKAPPKKGQGKRAKK